jgi:hypothetical protein
MCRPYMQDKYQEKCVIVSFEFQHKAQNGLQSIFYFPLLLSSILMIISCMISVFIAAIFSSMMA